EALELRCALSVSWDGFEALRTESGDVEVRWRTLAEEDTSYFAIERGPSRWGPFVRCGLRNATGGAGAYDWTDLHAPCVPIWYRIVEYTGSGAGDATPVF